MFQPFFLAAMRRNHLKQMAGLVLGIRAFSGRIEVHGALLKKYVTFASLNFEIGQLL